MTNKIERKYVCLMLGCIFIFSFISNKTIIAQGIKTKKKIEEIDTKKIIVKTDMDFHNILLTDALAILTKVTDITFIADKSVEDIKINIFIGKNKSLEEIINIFKLSKNLIIKKTGKTFIFSKKYNNEENGRNCLYGRIILYDVHKVNKNAKGIEGVKITLLDSGLNPVFTKFNGMFLIENIVPGIYLVRIEKEGYDMMGEILKIKEDEETFLELKMYKSKNNYKKDNLKDGIIEKNKLNDLSLGNTKSKEGDDSNQISTERIILENAFATDIKKVVLSSIEGVEIVDFNKLNMVILKGNRENIEVAKNLIRDLDKPLKQVKITAQILDVTDNLFEDLGFSWNYISDGSAQKNKTDGGFGKVGVISGIGKTYSTEFNLIRTFNSGEDIFNFSVSMLEATQDLMISAIPSIVIINGEEAEFRITDEVIVGEERVEDDTRTETTRTTPLFKEAGLIFKVKPIIRNGLEDDESIFLEIDTEVSNFNLKTTESGENTGTFNSNGGSKSMRKITTHVKVRSGESLFIGGLKRVEEREIISKVPILGDIPYIGFLFRKKSMRNEKRDIYIKVKAEIVDETFALN